MNATVVINTKCTGQTLCCEFLSRVFPCILAIAQAFETIYREKSKDGKCEYEEREYDLLPAQMDKLMKEISQSEARLEDPAFYQNHPQEFMKVTENLTHAKEELARAETKWLELDEVMSQS